MHVRQRLLAEVRAHDAPDGLARRLSDPAVVPPLGRARIGEHLPQALDDGCRQGSIRVVDPAQTDHRSGFGLAALIEHQRDRGGAVPEQLAALKKVDNDFAVQMRQLDIDLERIKSENVDSARKMQMATRSYMPAVLAVLITVGYFGILIGLLAGMLKLSNNEALLILIGALSTAWGAVVQFFFGSSSGSQAKDAVIASRK